MASPADCPENAVVDKSAEVQSPKVGELAETVLDHIEIMFLDFSAVHKVIVICGRGVLVKT